VWWRASPGCREAKDYVDFRVRGILTMVRRVESVANASSEKWGDKNAICDVRRNVRHLRESLEDMAVAK
jgi:hypothetical protein